MAIIACFDIDPSGHSKFVDPTLDLPGVGYRWIHLDLMQDDVSHWVERYVPISNVPPLLQSETRPHFFEDEDGVVIILRGINLNPGQDLDDMVSLRCWIGKNILITARKRKIYSVDEIRQEAQNGHARTTPLAQFGHILNRLTQRIESQSLQFDEDTTSLEDAIFEDDMDKRGESLAPLRKSLIRLHRYLAPQNAALHQLVNSSFASHHKQTRRSLEESANQLTRSVEEISSLLDRLGNLSDYVFNMQSQRQGKNSYILSIIAAIFLPLGFLTGLFGVNVAGMPGVETPWAFAALSIGTLGIGVLTLIFLKWLKLY